jgi:hypothetical protein
MKSRLAPVLPLAAIRFFEVTAELTLKNAVHALDLLLLAQLQAEIRGSLAGSPSMLARF